MTTRQLISTLILGSLWAFLGCEMKLNKDNTVQKNGVTETDSSTAMEEFRNEQLFYNKLTVERLDTIDDDKLVEVVMYNLWSKMDKSMIDDYEVVTHLSQPRQAIYIIWQVESEVNNGGFNQFYYNSSGRFANQAENAFKLISAAKFATLVHKANELYAANEKQIKKEQDGTTEGFSRSYDDNPLNELDGEFYKLYDQEDLPALMVKFIRQNKMDFVDAN